MLYYIVRPIATVTLKVFFRKIYLGNENQIPLNKPVIFVCNHPTAFLEPCILACVLPRPLNFMVRGNLFKSKYLNELLFGLHLIPIYRKDDAMEKRRNNASILKTCFRYLQEDKAILIMGEGHTKVGKHLRPLKKGPARLAFGSLDFDETVDVLIVPVGVTFSRSDKFRSEVYFDCGKPIKLQDYADIYREHRVKGMRVFTDDLRNELIRHLIHIEDPADNELCEQAFEIYRNNDPQNLWPVLVKDNKRLSDQQNISNKVNLFSVQEKAGLKKQFGNYFEDLEKNTLQDVGLAMHTKPIQFLWLLPAGIFFITGFLSNIPPLYLSHIITKHKVKSAEYKGPMKVALGMLGYVVYFILMLGVFIVAPFSWWFIFLIPLSGYFALVWWERFLNFYHRYQANKGGNNLLERRQELSELVNSWVHT